MSAENSAHDKSRPFRELLELDFQHIVSAHGPPIVRTAKADLRGAVDVLYPPR